MGFENFPYTNFHELNLDWIAKIAKDFLEQYTHIQELIANGEQSLQELTASGLADLQAKADELKHLLDEWYNTHSADIANQLAQAVADFQAQAVQIVDSVTASIPADYSTLSTNVQNLIDSVSVLPVELSQLKNVFENEERWGVTGFYNRQLNNYTFTGTSTNTSPIFWNVLNEHFPSEIIKPGKQYIIRYSSTYGNLYGEYVFLNGGNIISSGTTTTPLTNITIPVTGVDQFILRIRVSPNRTYNDTISLQMYDFDNAQPFNVAARSMTADTDLNAVTKNGIYFLDNARSYGHSPLIANDEGGILYVNSNIQKSITCQMIITTISRRMLFRTYLAGWNAWTESVPEIPSTNDDTDRTAEIQFYLDTFKYCRLSNGTFHITGVVVPNNGTLEGCGNSTVIMLKDSVASGSAVTLRNFACVRNLKLQGSMTELARPAAVGTRNGVAFVGNADASTPSTYYRASIQNCNIRWFTGSGIYFNNTGYDISADTVVSNCIVYGCGAGININRFSEYHRISNCTFQENLFGCIDNGGNNNFANCDFSANTTGLLIDNENDQSPNNSHGSFVGCSFNHSGSNTGDAIHIKKARAGEIFTAIQVFYGNIIVENSTGIRFIGLNCGNGCPITLTDNTVITFSDSTFKDNESPVTKHGNTALVFDNCFTRSGTVFNP